MSLSRPLIALLASFAATSGFFSLEGQAITAIPATLFAWVLATGVAMFRAGPVTVQPGGAG